MNEQLLSLLGNPMFNVGMGLLSANHTGADPFAATVGGLLSTYQARQAFSEDQQKRKLFELELQQAQEEMARQQKLREFLAPRELQGPPAPGQGQPMQMPSPQRVMQGLLTYGDPKTQASVATGLLGGTPDYRTDDQKNLATRIALEAEVQRDPSKKWMLDWFDNSVRASPLINMGGGAQGVYNPLSGNTTGPLVAPELIRQLEMMLKQAQSYGTNVGSGEAERDVNAPQTVMRADQQISSADNVISTVDEALEKVGPFTTGLMGAFTDWVRGSTAYDLRQAVSTIKANLGFDRLQQMREASPTGGALGQVAVQELNALQSALASLDPGQSEEVLRANLIKVKQHYDSWKRIQQAVRQQALMRMQNTGQQPLDVNGGIQFLGFEGQ